MAVNMDGLGELDSDACMAAYYLGVQHERERCLRIVEDHRPDRPLASRATADAIAAAITPKEPQNEVD